MDKSIYAPLLESVEKPVEKEPVDLSERIEKCVLQMESLAYDRGITVSLDAPDDVFILSEKEYTERIVGGLIENALKYEPDGGTVRVALTETRKKAVLSVQNPGGVIDPADLPHVFERFYRGDKARDLKSGHGLGLSIIKQMADRLGAEIAVKSDPADGTVFTAVFDLAEQRPSQLPHGKEKTDR